MSFQVGCDFKRNDICAALQSNPLFPSNANPDIWCAYPSTLSFRCPPEQDFMLRFAGPTMESFGPALPMQSDRLIHENNGFEDSAGLFAQTNDWSSPKKDIIWQSIQTSCPSTPRLENHCTYASLKSSILSQVTLEEDSHGRMIPAYEGTISPYKKPSKSLKYEVSTVTSARELDKLSQSQLPSITSGKDISSEQVLTSRITHLGSSLDTIVQDASLSDTIFSSCKRYWSSAEDELLLNSVASVQKTFDSPLPWGMVARELVDRTATMCSKRFRQLQRQKDDEQVLSYTRGSWTPEEDADLLATIAECRSMSRLEGMPLPWTRIGSMLKQPRSGLQVCARYTEALDPSVIRGRWTKEEDAKLLEEYVRSAGRWSLICQEIKGRTQRQCASRYGVLTRGKKTRRRNND